MVTCIIKKLRKISTADQLIYVETSNNPSGMTIKPVKQVVTACSFDYLNVSTFHLYKYITIKCAGLKSTPCTSYHMFILPYASLLRK